MEMSGREILFRLILATGIAVVLLLILGWAIRHMVPPEDLVALMEACGEECIFV